MRSTLAGVAETGSETAKRLEGFASMRSMLAGLAETGCKKQSLTAFGGAPFTQGSLIKPSPVGEGGSRRLTDEVYFCKRNFNYRGISNKRLICGIFVVYL